MIPFLLRALGGAIILPVVPLMFLEGLWRRHSERILWRFTGPVKGRFAPARWVYERRRRRGS